MDDEWVEGLLDALAGEDEQTLDQVFRLLSDRYVRQTLFYLSSNPTTTLDELADVIAGWEATAQETIVTPVDRDRIRIRLYHVILPRLDEAGYIHFDITDHAIERTSVPSPVSTVLEELRNPDR